MGTDAARVRWLLKKPFVRVVQTLPYAVWRHSAKRTLGHLPLSVYSYLRVRAFHVRLYISVSTFVYSVWKSSTLRFRNRYGGLSLN